MENYKKYTREVITNIEESLSKIVTKVAENSLVLDIGCSSGMMGRYLALNKGCIVDGVDIDEKAVENCKPVYRKVAVRNLEVDDLTDVFVTEAYDFIVVADVIEHLNNPDRLLGQLKLLLKPHGTIIFSVPNITHIASSLELLLGNFEYRQNGLLDSTHLRFYSYKNLIAKLMNSGLYVWDSDSVRKDVDETEFGNEQRKLFPPEWLKTLIANRADALVYQWILSTRIYPRLDAEIQPAVTKIAARPVFTSALYWASSAGADFSETNKIIGVTTGDAGKDVTLDFEFQVLPDQKIQKIRIDPISELKAVWIKSARIVGVQNELLWEWDADQSVVDVAGAKWVDADVADGKVLRAESDDPQWYPEIPVFTLQRITPGTRFAVVICEDERVVNAVLIEAFSTRQAALIQTLAERDERTNDLVAQTNDLAARINDLVARINDLVAEGEQKRVAYRAHVAELESALGASEHARVQEVRGLRNQLDAVFASRSWKITAPLRRFSAFVQRARNAAARRIGSVKHALPISVQTREKFKDVIYPGFGFALRGFSLPRKGKGDISLFSRDFTTTLHRHSAYVEKKSHDDDINTSIKLIAFYLPQFHPVPENDLWWGEGFTEWTNVSKSVPQFEGHYQPHLPGELGFYDLRLPEIQKKQAELARLYGIYGFCIYHYWFGGQKILERPMDQLLKNPGIDINFCLCWANENWTRRWDGLEEHILIGQNHSDEDDLAFIEDIAKAFRDPRYIRVEGKPLLMVYRPKLLPDPLKTSNIWRNWCRNNGIGEIFLVTVQSFDVMNPQEMGFDAATEFPPLNFPLSNITDSIKPINPEFSGNIYDYRVMAAKSESYDSYDYELYRAAMPGWDNSARRPGNGHIHFYSEPKIYEKWLHNACKDSVINLPESRRFVFVNAWNEWAEGAHLEPDRFYGYAYLDATAKVLAQHPVTQFEGKIRSEKIAVVLHLYYTDLWEEIRGYLANLPAGFRLFVSLDQHVDEKIVMKIRESYPCSRIYKKENRGRDILPFIEIIPDIKKFGCDYICKIHSKKSLHRENGDAWRSDIYKKLLGNRETILDILNQFSSNQDIGIICPDGHLLDIGYFWGTNKETVLALASEYGLEKPSDNYKFVAGSMFWARVIAIDSLVEMKLRDRFEDERGQIDGTLAHAMERLIPLIASSRKLSTMETGMIVNCDLPSETNLAGSVGEKYAYAKGTPS